MTPSVATGGGHVTPPTMSAVHVRHPSYGYAAGAVVVTSAICPHAAAAASRRRHRILTSIVTTATSPAAADGDGTTTTTAANAVGEEEEEKEKKEKKSELDADGAAGKKDGWRKIEKKNVRGTRMDRRAQTRGMRAPEGKAFADVAIQPKVRLHTLLGSQLGTVSSISHTFFF